MLSSDSLYTVHVKCQVTPNSSLCCCLCLVCFTEVSYVISYWLKCDNLLDFVEMWFRRLQWDHVRDHQFARSLCNLCLHGFSSFDDLDMSIDSFPVWISCFVLIVPVLSWRWVRLLKYTSLLLFFKIKPTEYHDMSIDTFPVGMLSFS